MSLRKVFAQTMVEVASRDENLVVIVGDISHGIFAEFRSEHPNRYFNIGICEPAMVNIAAGLSANGINPVVHTIAPFLIERSYEQIKLDFAYQELGVNLISVGAAYDYSKLGCSHHCYSDYSLIAKFNDSRVFFPGSEIEFKTLFESQYNNGKINYFRLTEYPHDEILSVNQIEPGKAIKIRDGNDMTILTTGSLLTKVKKAASELTKEGIEVEILYYHTLQPFDVDTLKTSLRKTRRIITFEDLSSQDGLFNKVNSSIAGAFSYKSCQIAIPDFVRNYGSHEELSSAIGLTSENILLQALKLMDHGN